MEHSSRQLSDPTIYAQTKDKMDVNANPTIHR